MINLTGIEPQTTGTTTIFGLTMDSALLADGFTYVTVDSLCEAFTVDPAEHKDLLLEAPSQFTDYLVMVRFPSWEASMLSIRIDWIPDFVLTLDYAAVTDPKVKEIMHTIFDRSRIALAKQWGLASSEDLEKLKEIDREKWNRYF